MVRWRGTRYPGLKFARSGNKAPPFSRQLMFCVTVDLHHLCSGKVLLKNKASRVRSIVESMDKLILAGKIEPGVAASLHGSDDFAQGQ